MKCEVILTSSFISSRLSIFIVAINLILRLCAHAHSTLTLQTAVESIHLNCIANKNNPFDWVFGFYVKSESIFVFSLWFTKWIFMVLH